MAIGQQVYVGYKPAIFVEGQCLEGFQLLLHLHILCLVLAGEFDMPVKNHRLNPKINTQSIKGLPTTVNILPACIKTTLV